MVCPKYRALTAAREFGSGGARIAASLAETLGWSLLDSRLIEEIAGLAQVDFGLAAGCRDWRDPHLYDLMIGSKRGEDAVASTILSAMREW